MRKRFNKNIFLATFSLLAPAITYAATATETPKQGSSFNAILIGLVCLVFVLLFAILVLGNTLRQLGFVYRDKLRNDRASGVMKSLLLLILTGLSSFAVQAQEATTVVKPVSSGVINGIASSDFYALMGILGLELLVVVSLVLLIRRMVRLISGVEQTEELAAPKVAKVNFWDRFNKVVPLEKEHDILLDHNYDGIQELDNSLPPWWKYGFYLTIVTGVIYLWYFHGGGKGPSSYDEYVAEVKAGEESKAAYLAKSANNVDENTVAMLTADGIAAGKTIFEASCAACHLKDGGGIVGPNLTDEYWIHGGSIKDVFKSIKYGWPDKGMKSWKDDFSPNQIAQLASFVMSLKGTKPLTPKEKQGELYIEGGALVDSAATVADTVKK